MRLLLVSALALPITLTSIACEDPSANKPAATVGDTKSDVAKAADGLATAAKTAGAKKFTFSGENSTVEFTGSKVTGSHDGGFKTFSGEIAVDNGRVVAVSTTIDMTSVFSDAEKLTGHLQSPDFFDIGNHPKSSFESTKIVSGDDGKATVTGNPTLRGVTKEISFPATIAVDASSVKVDAEFSINRKDFNIVYAGKADDLIRDGVVLKLHLKANG